MAKVAPAVCETVSVGKLSSLNERPACVTATADKKPYKEGHTHGHGQEDLQRNGSKERPRNCNNGDRGSVIQEIVYEWRLFMYWSGWYDSAYAFAMRSFLRGRVYTILTMISLFIALFFADLCVICQVPNNVAANVVLSLVFGIFLVEFVGLACTDVSYLFSFFFWMDLVGTVSLIFDIPYMLGTDATEAEKYTGQRGNDNLIVVRAARAAKLGARAGRLSRVMKLLRFLPFVNNSDQGGNVKMARVISHQLTNVLSTRVAFLTICIVVVLPIFGMFTYPEVDDSMGAWTQLLAENVDELYGATYATTPNATFMSEARTRLQAELDRFSRFYADLSYGPFSACYGEKLNSDGDFRCIVDTSIPVSFTTSFSEPDRKASIRAISETRLQVSYDLEVPRQLESVANIGMICFIIVVMCVFGLLTSSSISVIALEPLERMLSVVRDRCKQIFQYTNDLQEDDSEDEEDDQKGEEYDETEQDTEFVLLEKVVGKLAAIAHLSAPKEDLEYKDGMTENDVMQLAWKQGAQVSMQRRNSLRKSGIPEDTTEGAENGEMQRGSRVVASTLNSIPSDIVEALESPNFNALSMALDMKIIVGAHIITSFEGSCVWVRCSVQDAQLQGFVTACSKRYNDNPFHNFAHAVDVEYAVARFMKLISADRFLPESTQFWLIIASIAHDLGHIGVNNQYLVEIGHELALKYNDRSPLENMHCASLFQITNRPENDVFSQVEKSLYKEMRQGIINAILHTDVTKHNEMVKALQILYEMNSEIFDEKEPTQKVVEVLESNTPLAINTLLHCADVGNPMKPWEIAQSIAYLCLDEFFAQGDAEKEAEIPVQMLNDRNKVNRPNSQIGFIEFVIAPMVVSIVHVFSHLDGLAENLGHNAQRWFDVWVAEVNPAAEAAAKTQARVHKIVAQCEGLMRTDVKLPMSNG